MAQASLTIFDFQARFSTEYACWKHLYAARWPDGYVCPACGGRRSSFVSTRKLTECLDCRWQTTLTAGTAMHRSKMPLRVWFWGAYLVATNGPGISAFQFQKQVGLSRYETAFHMLHKLRAALPQGDGERLSGTVEVDETFVGGRAHGPSGRGALGKTIVVGAVEVGSGGRRPYSAGIRLRAIRDASRRSLVRFLKDRVERGATVRTDEWRGYSRLEEAGYRHVLAANLDELKHVHRAFSNLKVWLKGTHHYVSGKHLQAYLNEFCFRQNHRRSRVVAFGSLLGLAMHERAPTYKELYRAGRRGGWAHPNPPDNG